MDNQVRRGLGDLVSPLTVNLTDIISTPGKNQRSKKSKRRERQALSSESSTKKPPRKEFRMSSKDKGVVATAVNQLEGTKVDSNEVQMDDDDQQVTGCTEPPGSRPVRTGAQGEKFVREFSKISLVKKEIHDNQDEKAFRRDNVPCHYDALCENFVAKRYSNEGMLP